VKTLANRIINAIATRSKSVSRTGDSFDVIDIAFLKAAYESAEFYETHLLRTKVFNDTLEMISDGLSIAPKDGLVLEFGVATGRTITRIAQHRPGPVYGFDSFEGLPEDWYPGYEKGAFARDTLPPVPANVELVKGWFNETLPGFLAEHPGPVAYINIDCDLYSSTAYVLDQLQDRIVPGTVIQFDEYFNYPGWKQHEYKAFAELVERTGLKFRYHSFYRGHQAVCVVIE
jgi:hypothetical protein